MVKARIKPKRTDKRVTVSAPPELVRAMRSKSRSDMLAYSRATQLFWIWWVSGGDPRSLQPRQRTDGGDLAATAQAERGKAK